MTFTLFTARRAGSVTPHCLLAEVGAEVKTVEIDLGKFQQLDAAYVKVNPMGRVPALALPDGSLMTESAAIVLALGEMFPAAEFLPPAGSPERFQFYRWLLFVSNNIYEAVGREDYPERYSTDPAHAPAIKARAIEDLRRFWSMIERDLKPDPHAIGGRFSALDLYMANLSQWIVGQDWLKRECPRVAGLADIVRARPLMAPVWNAHFPAR